MEYIIAVVLFAIVIGIAMFFVKKEQEKLKEMEGSLSDEQKNKLALTEVKFVEGKNDEWIQDGIIGEMTEKGNKFAIKVLWHNKVIQNATFDKL